MTNRMFCCSKYCGQKRPFAVWTLAVAVIGMGILVYVSAASLYDDTLNDDGMSNNSYNYSPSLPVVAYLDNSTAPDLREMKSSDLQALMDNTSSKTSLQPFPSLPPGQNNNSSATLVSLPPSQYQQSTETAHNASTNASTTSEYLTTIAILGIVGFVLSDHGYDSSMSTFKAYMVAVTPASQQNDIFILGTLTGAVGGCVTSLLGFVDLGGLLPEEDGEVLDKGMAQGLIQALILLISLVVLGCVSLVTGSESSSHACGFEASIEEGDTDIDQCRNVSKDSVTKPPFVATTSIEENENMPLIYERSTQGCCCAQLSTFWRRWKRRVLLCSMTFMGLFTNYSYFVYVSNYVAEVIFYGDPNADTESEAYANYVKGVHVASLGMLAFYFLFVVFNVFHQKILDKIGMRREYLGSSVCCAALMLLLASTNSLVFFFLNAVTMATFRAAVYTVPFILSNNLAKEEAKETKRNSVDSSGVAMATISAMIPGSYFVVSLVMGPLMDATGNPGMPIIVAAGITLDGKHVPAKPLTPDFDIKRVTRAYLTTLEGSGLLHKNAAAGFSLDRFTKGYALFCFDLTPSLVDGDQFELVKSAPMRLELKFAKALPNPVVVLVYGELDGLIEVNKSRQVLTDFAV
ncbi:hypothetical protein ACOMHN_033817 [Nucella lapillus]